MGWMIRRWGGGGTLFGGGRCRGGESLIGKEEDEKMGDHTYRGDSDPPHPPPPSCDGSGGII